MLLLYIWQDGEGLRIVTRQACSTEFERTLENRLQKYIYDRIFEMHRLMSLDLDTLENTKAILAYVLNEKPYLLKDNYIDQIIVCSLFASLRLHRALSHVSL